MGISLFINTCIHIPYIVSRPASATQAPVVQNTNIQTASPPPGATTNPGTFAPFVTSTTSMNAGGSSKGASVSGSPECGTEYFYCKLDSLCIPVEWLCDADVDCSDGDDEHQSCREFYILTYFDK